MKIFKKITAGVVAGAMSLGMATTYVGANSTDYLRGDIDGDGDVDIVDVAYLANFLSGTKGSADDHMSQRLDVDLSGVIDILDKNMLSNILVGNITSDTINYEIENAGIPFQSPIYYREYNAQTGAQIGDDYLLSPVSVIPDYSPRTIIGTDDRDEDYTQTAVVKLKFKQNGDWYNGTGFIVSDNLILTAAHCVYDTATDAPSTNMTYTIYNSNGTVNTINYASTYHLPTTYINLSSWDSSCDYALIVVNDDLSDYGFLDLGIARDKLKSNANSSIYKNHNSKLGIYVNGYSGDNPNGSNADLHYEMVSGCGNLGNPYLTNSVLYYSTDTVGGESGGPVFVKTNSGTVIVIGIHSGNDPYDGIVYNEGKRIDTNVLNLVHNYSHTN